MGNRTSSAAQGNQGSGQPDKRRRIVVACLSVVAQYGVAATTHRKIAAAAGVPLGLTTYYFARLDDLLYAAFAEFASDGSASFADDLRAATSPEDAVTVLVAFILAGQKRGNAESVITHELYTLAAREERFRGITQQWMHANRAALGRLFDEDTVRMLDPLIEGLTIHGLLGVSEPDADLVERAIRRIVRL